MTFVDSSVWIDHLRGRAQMHHVQAFRLLVEEFEPIVVGDVVLMEVLMGAPSPKAAALIEASMSAFGVVSVLDAEVATAAARNYRRLRGAGRTVRSSVDLMIGTFCIAHGYALLHNDRDFEPMHEMLGLRRARLSPP